MQKLYISFDIEADGQCPSVSSMLSIGMCGLLADGTEVFSWQRNLYPLADRKPEERCMTEFWSKQPEAWKFVQQDQLAADDAMIELADNIRELKLKYRLVWVASPSAYDWQWLKAYYELTRKTHPDMPDIGFSARCLSSMWWSYTSRNGLDGKQSDALWERLSGVHKMTHNPLDDARSQGAVFIGLCKLDGITLL